MDSDLMRWVKAQADDPNANPRFRELYAAMSQQPEPKAEARGKVVAWFPTYANGEIVRNYGDGSPVYAYKTKEEAEQAKRCHLGATGPVIPLYAAPPPAACRCVDCGGDHHEHDSHCAYMREIHEARQPAAVDEFAADRERLLRAFMMECGIIGAKEAGVNLARGIKAALAAQQQEPKP